MTTWAVLTKIRGAFALIALIITLAVVTTTAPFTTCEEEAEARLTSHINHEKQESGTTFQERWNQAQQEREARWALLNPPTPIPSTEASLTPPLLATPKRTRRVQRFVWESPAEARGKIWNIPEEESEQAVLDAFLRVCIAEADGHLPDCIGIWQVVKNIRRRSCERAQVRRITECTEEDGETFLSALRRSQRHVLGQVPPQNRRVLWISKLTTECEPPDEWPGTLDSWNSRYTQRCQRVVELGRYLVKGELPPSVPGFRPAWLPGRPITWGGRCETSAASCDDRIACERGLARIPGVEYTKNAFWCRPGSPACLETMEPVCLALGYGQPLSSPSVTKTLDK